MICEYKNFIYAVTEDYCDYSNRVTITHKTSFVDVVTLLCSCSTTHPCRFKYIQPCSWNLKQSSCFAGY